MLKCFHTDLNDANPNLIPGSKFGTKKYLTGESVGIDSTTNELLFSTALLYHKQQNPAEHHFFPSQPLLIYKNHRYYASFFQNVPQSL